MIRYTLLGYFIDNALDKHGDFQRWVSVRDDLNAFLLTPLSNSALTRAAKHARIYNNEDATRTEETTGRIEAGQDEAGEV